MHFLSAKNLILSSTEIISSFFIFLTLTFVELTLLDHNHFRRAASSNFFTSPERINGLISLHTKISGTLELQWYSSVFSILRLINKIRNEFSSLTTPKNKLFGSLCIRQICWKIPMCTVEFILQHLKVKMHFNKSIPILGFFIRECRNVRHQSCKCPVGK